VWRDETLLVVAIRVAEDSIDGAMVLLDCCARSSRAAAREAIAPQAILVQSPPFTSS